MLKTLIIDDDKLIRWSLKEIFTQEGHQVDTASSEEEALNHARSTGYDVVFADFELEDSDAAGMLKSLQRIRPEAVVIILSALPIGQIEPRLQGIEVLRIVEKPFEPEQIRAILRMVRDRDTSLKS
jgi:two-component system response regulator (stage 0 sporulation protein F)